MGRKPKTSPFQELIKELKAGSPENKKTVSIALPITLIEDLDRIAEELAQGNRSFICEKALGTFVEEYRSYQRNINK